MFPMTKTNFSQVSKHFFLYVQRFQRYQFDYILDGIALAFTYENSGVFWWQNPRQIPQIGISLYEMIIDRIFKGNKAFRDAIYVRCFLQFRLSKISLRLEKTQWKLSWIFHSRRHAEKSPECLGRCQQKPN